MLGTIARRCGVLEAGWPHPYVRAMGEHGPRHKPTPPHLAIVGDGKKVPFDAKVFLATANGGRTLSKYRTDKVIFSQGDPADAVFYIQKGQVKVTGDDRHNASARESFHE